MPERFSTSVDLPVDKGRLSTSVGLRAPRVTLSSGPLKASSPGLHVDNLVPFPISGHMRLQGLVCAKYAPGPR